MASKSAYMGGIVGSKTLRLHFIMLEREGMEVQALASSPTTGASLGPLPAGKNATLETRLLLPRCFAEGVERRWDP